jgi:hypothetical protein
MVRRTDGRGTVHHQADGRWEAQLRLDDGRRKSLYSRNRRDVLRQLRDTRWQVYHGVPVSTRNLLLSDYLRYWLEVETG